MILSASMPRLRTAIFSLAFLACTQIVHAQEKEIGMSYEDNSDNEARGMGKTRLLADSLYFGAVKAKMMEDDNQAMTMFEQFAKLKPEVAATYYELAKLYRKEGKNDKAKEDVEKAISLDSDNKWYKEEYASILAEAGEFEDAAKVVSSLADKEEDNSEYLLMSADYYLRAKNYKEALAYLDKIIARTGEDEDVMLQKVQIYLSMNDLTKASGVIQQLITQNPNEGKYYKLLGEMYDNNKQPDKAKEVYDKAITILPNDATIQLGLAEHFLKNNDTASYLIYARKAVVNKDLDAETQVGLLESYLQDAGSEVSIKTDGLDLIKQIVAQHPANAEALALYGSVLALANMHVEAVEEFKKSLAIDPSKFNVWERFLGNYTDRADADSLIKYSEKAIRLFPNQALVHYFNGVGYFNKKNYSSAIKSINRAVDLQPDSNPQLLAEMYATLGDIYNIAKEYTKSDESYEHSLRLDPDNATVLNNYSYYLSERGIKLDEAERMSNRSLALQPSQATFLDTYGWILYKRGNYEKAREYIQKAIDANPQNADGTLFNHLGNVYFKLNDKSKAVENWKKAKEKGDDDPQLDKKISEEKLYE